MGKENKGNKWDHQEVGESLLGKVGGPDVVTKSLKGSREKQSGSVIGKVLFFF